jgi:hypothetical protein
LFCWVSCEYRADPDEQVLIPPARPDVAQKPDKTPACYINCCCLQKFLETSVRLLHCFAIAPLLLRNFPGAQRL